MTKPSLLLPESTVLEGNPCKQVISEQNLLAYQLFCWFLQNLDSVFSTLLMLYWLDLLVFLAYKCHNLQMRPAETVGFVTTEKKITFVLTSKVIQLIRHPLIP